MYLFLKQIAEVVAYRQLEYAVLCAVVSFEKFHRLIGNCDSAHIGAYIRQACNVSGGHEKAFVGK